MFFLGGEGLKAEYSTTGIDRILVFRVCVLCILSATCLSSKGSSPRLHFIYLLFDRNNSGRGVAAGF